MNVANSQKVLPDVLIKTPGSPFVDGADERSMGISAAGEALINTNLVLTNFLFDKPPYCTRQEQSQKSCTNAYDSWYSQDKKEAVQDTPQVVETEDVLADDAGAATFCQDQKGQQGAWRSIVESTPSCGETTTDQPGHRAAATAIRWASRSWDDVGSGVYGHCHGVPTTAPPSTPAEGAVDHCRQA